MMRLMRTEPAVISGAILAFISLVTSFGLDLSNEQVGAIMAFVAAVMAIVVRSQVTPSVKVTAEKDSVTGMDVAGEAAAPEIPENAPVDVTAIDGADLEITRDTQRTVSPS